MSLPDRSWRKMEQVVAFYIRGSFAPLQVKHDDIHITRTHNGIHSTRTLGMMPVHHHIASTPWVLAYPHRTCIHLIKYGSRLKIFQSFF